MRFILVVCLSTILLATIIDAEKVRFDNYQVFSIRIENQQQIDLINTLENYGYQLWNSPQMNGYADVMVPPHKLGDFADTLKLWNMQAELKIENVQTLMDNERMKNRPRAFTLNDYNTLEEIYGWLDEQIDASDGALTNIVMGQSFQGRDIRVVKLSYKEGNPGIFIESTIHAREWITAATTLWILNELLHSEDPAVRNIAENVDWYIMPVYNVDGYAYTHSANRSWRKTRQNHTTICYGTDLNRNFGFQWQTGGSSDNPCVDSFAGPSPWSEPEAVALSRFFNDNIQFINLYVSFHCYGQLLMFPYGFTTTTAPTHTTMQEIGDIFADAIAVRHGTQFEVGPIATTIYLASGSSLDYVYNAHDSLLSYVFELRDTGRYGFVLPADQIEPSGEEILDGFITLVAETQERGILQRKR